MSSKRRAVAPRRFGLVVLALLVTAAAGAWDVGGYIDNTSGFESAPGGPKLRDVPEDPGPLDPKPTDVRDLIQRFGVGGWLYHEMGNWTLDAEVSAYLQLSFEERTDPDASRLQLSSFVPDMDRLVLSGVFPAEAAGARSLGIEAGRLEFADSTGYVLDHRLDGVKISVGLPSSAFSAGIGTSALLQLPTASIVMSNLDVVALPTNSPIHSVFASPRLLATFDYRMRSLFAGQDLTLGAVVQEDLRPAAQYTPEFTTDFDPGAGGAMDTQYLSLGISGGIAQGLFHRTSYSLNTGRTMTYLADADSVTGFSYQYTPVLAHLVGTELTWFLPQVLNSRIRLGGMFSTGDEDATAYYDGNSNELATQFVPISAIGFSDVFTLQPGNSSHLAIFYSLRPLSGIGLDILQTEVSSIVYFRSAGTGPVSEGSVDATSTGSYVGTDVGLKVAVQPFSDLRFVLDGGMFIPNAAVMSTDNETVDYQLTLQGVLRF